MKKLTVLAALLLAVSAGTTAFAQTEYDPNTQSVSNTDQGSYQTVLITRGGASDTVTDGNIVYVAQAADKFGAATDFLLKYNSENGTSVADGVYTIRFGGGTEAHEPVEFAVGVGITGYDIPLEVKGDPVGSDGNYSWGFVTSEGVSLTEDDIILVQIGNAVMAYPIKNAGISLTNATVMFGIQIDDVTTNASDGVKVYLRHGAKVVTATE